LDAYLQKYREIYSPEKQDVLRKLAHIKRFLERFTGDKDFRDDILSGKVEIAHAASLIGCDVSIVDFSTLRPFFDPEYANQRKTELLKNWPAAHLWNEYIEALTGLRNEMTSANDTGGYNIAFDSWRIRQVNRASADLGVACNGIVHPVIAFELSSGCSVGCWFCGVSAERFKGHFSLANGGAEEWRNTLKEVTSVLGGAVRSGFLYWATDPLDNPDYLGILDIFYEKIKVYPQTTTAIPLRNLDLTRGVVDRWSKGKAYPNRFSILNKKTLLGVHEQFTPEELLSVELVLQNTGNSSNVKTNAGKAIPIKAIDSPNGTAKKGFVIANGTIACVTGFLINIVEKTVRLVSPCMPTSDIPDGYIVFASSKYNEVSELGAVLRKMIAENMSIGLNPDALIQFNQNIKYTLDKEGHGKIEGSGTKIEAPMVDLIGKYLTKGPVSARELLKLAVVDGKSPFAVIDAIEKTRWAGFIDIDMIPESI